MFCTRGHNNSLGILYVCRRDRIAACVKIGKARRQQSGIIAVCRPNCAVGAEICASGKLGGCTGGDVQGICPGFDACACLRNAQGTAGLDLHTGTLSGDKCASQLQIARLVNPYSTGAVSGKGKLLCIYYVGS